MADAVVFYSWQSDLPKSTTRDVIRTAADLAVKRIASGSHVEEAVRLDSDVHGESGSPAICETIFRKIAHAAVFLGDVTFVDKAAEKHGAKPKRLPNPNVLIELGYAAAEIGW